MKAFRRGIFIFGPGGGFTQKKVFRLVMVLAVCVFVLANLSVGKLVRFLGLSIDFTGERLYSLSDDTKNAIPALQSETVIYAISSEEADIQALAFGLHNVHQRIRLYFGERYGIAIDSVQAEYTRVCMTLPLKYRPAPAEEDPKTC